MFAMWVLRFFCFKLYESPKYLMGRGRDEEAVAVMHKVAEYNGKTSSLRLERLQEVDDIALSSPSSVDDDAEKAASRGFDTSAKAAALRKMQKFDTGHVRSLFATRKLAWSTSLLITLWGECSSVCCASMRSIIMHHRIALIGLAFPL